MSVPLSVRLRLATPTAMLDGKQIDVTLPPSMLALNPYLVAELVEDHPTFIKSADIDADLDEDARAELLHAAVEYTLRAHEFRTGVVTATLEGGARTQVHALTGPPPWTTAFALALATGWCPVEALAGRPLRIAIPTRYVVFYVAEAAVQDDPRLGAALEELAREAYERADDREALFAGTFIAADGQLRPARDYGAAPTLELDGTSSTNVDALAPIHVTMRRLLAAIVEAIVGSERDLAGALAELASQSLGDDAEYGGPLFVPAVATVLDRASSSFPAWLRRAVRAVPEAVVSPNDDALLEAVHGVMKAIDSNTGRRLAEVEAQMAGMDPWFSDTNVITTEELAEIADDDLPAFAHRVGWLAVAELRPHIGAEARHDLAQLAARGIRDGNDAWLDLGPAAFALLEDRLEASAAIRVAWARLSVSLTLTYRGLTCGLEPASARRLVAELVATWQWVRGVVATSPPTTPLSRPRDATDAARRLLADWTKRGGAASTSPRSASGGADPL